MKIRFMNGKKVYVHEPYKHNTTIYSHEEAVMILNDIFKKAEESPEDCDRRLSSLLNAMEILMNLRTQKINQWEETIVYDGDDSKKARMPRLHIGTGKKQNSCNLKVHVGGLHKPPERKAYNDLLSDEFEVWRQRQQADQPST